MAMPFSRWENKHRVNWLSPKIVTSHHHSRTWKNTSIGGDKSNSWRTKWRHHVLINAHGQKSSHYRWQSSRAKWWHHVIINPRGQNSSRYRWRNCCVKWRRHVIIIARGQNSSRDRWHSCFAKWRRVIFQVVIPMTTIVTSTIRTMTTATTACPATTIATLANVARERFLWLLLLLQQMSRQIVENLRQALWLSRERPKTVVLAGFDRFCPFDHRTKT